MKILNFIKNHPIIDIWVLTFILYIINALKTNNPNPAGYFFLGLLLMAIFSPIIKRVGRKKETRDNIDYFVKKIAEEKENNNPN